MKNPAKKNRHFSRTAAAAAVIAALAAVSNPVWAETTEITVTKDTSLVRKQSGNLIEVENGDTAIVTVKDGGIVPSSPDYQARPIGLELYGKFDEYNNLENLIKIPDAKASITIEKDGYWFAGSRVADHAEYSYRALNDPSLFETVLKTMDPDEVTFEADVSGLWVGAIRVMALANVSLNIREGGILSTVLQAEGDTVEGFKGNYPVSGGYTDQETIAYYANREFAAAGGAAGQLAAGKTSGFLIRGDTYDGMVYNGFIYESWSLINYTRIMGLSSSAFGNKFDVTVSGAFYGPIVLSAQSSSARVMIEKTGVWTYGYIDETGEYFPSAEEDFYVGSPWDDEAGILDKYIPAATAAAEVFSDQYDEKHYKYLYRSRFNNGGQFDITVHGKWIGSATIGYLGAFSEASGIDTTGLSTAKEADYLSFNTTVGNGDGTEATWIGSLSTKAGAWGRVVLLPGSTWRYNPETVGTVALYWDQGSPNWDYSDSDAAQSVEQEFPVTFSGNAPSILIAKGQSDVEIAIGGNLYGGALVMGKSNLDFSLAKGGVWKAVTPGENPADYVYEYWYWDWIEVDDDGDGYYLAVHDQDHLANVTSVETNRGPVTARVYGQSVMNATISGAWTGDAVAQQQSALTVNCDSERHVGVFRIESVDRLGHRN